METIFSRFEVKKSNIKFDGDTKNYSLDCVGSLETELEVKTITKSCEGVVKKKVSRGSGAGTATISLHVPYEVYQKIYGMDATGLVKGVSAYGKTSTHKKFTYTGVVKDEEGNELLIALPNCVASSGPSMNIENGAEEVSEVEIELDLMPDEYDQCEYEAFVSEVESTITTDKWLKEFTPSMVHTPTA